MQMNHADTRIAFTAQAVKPSFSSIWGNEMQREDFLALAAGVRQFSASQNDLALVSNQTHVAEHAPSAAE